MYRYKKLLKTKIFKQHIYSYTFFLFNAVSLKYFRYPVRHVTASYSEFKLTVI